MWFSLLLLVLLLGIAFYQAMQGLLSSLIMLVLTVCCVAASLGTYEFVAIQWIAPKFDANYAVAVAIAVTFGVPLVVLRCAFDALIRRACLLPSIVDKAGAAVFGLLTSILLVGMAALALPNLPFNEGALVDFTRFDKADYISSEESRDKDPANVTQPMRNFWLSPDHTVCRVGSWLSSGLFSGERDFATDNPNLVEAMAWRNRVPAEAPRYAPPDAIGIVSAERVPEVYTHTPMGRRGNESFDPEPPAAGREYWAVRVRLNPSASPPGGKPLFTMRQFRLVGQDDEFGPFTQYHAIALEEKYEGETPPAGLARHIKYEVNFQKKWSLIDRLFTPRKGSQNTVEVVFEVPKSFEPWFLEFRYGARQKVTFNRGEAEGQPTESTTSRTPRRTPTSNEPEQTADSSSSQNSGRVPDSGRGGRVRTATTVAGKSKFSDQLPQAISKYREGNNTEVKRNGALVDGHLIAYLDEQDGGNNREVTRFEVPEDQRLLQLNVDTLRARSTYGKVMSRAKRVLQNFIVSDANGRQYQIVGKVAVADVRGRRVMEVQYFSHQAGSIGGVGEYDVIREEHLEQRGAQQYYLFLVEPGARIVTFSTGGSKTREDDLRAENLVAPS